MSARRRCSTFLAGSAWFMSVFGPTLAYGQDLNTRSNASIPMASNTAAKSAIPDVSLTTDGKLVGLLVDAQTKPISNSVVQLKQGLELVAQVKTDSQGVFRVDAPRGGVYQLTTEKENVAVRVWTNPSAPPAAEKLAVIMRAAPNVVRGQDLDEGMLGSIDLGTAALLGLGIATITVTSVNLDRTTDIKKANGGLNQQVAGLAQQNTQLNQQLAGVVQQNTQLNQQIGNLQNRIDRLAASLAGP